MRARRDLSIAEIVDHIDAEEDLLPHVNKMVQRRRVMRRLGNLRSKGLVICAGRREGVTRWASTKVDTLLGEATQVLAEHSTAHCLSDSEWTAISAVLPKRARESDRAAAARQFVDQVLRECTFYGAPRMTARQALRFLSWHELGIWQCVVDALDGRTELPDFEKLAEKLIRLRLEER